MSNPYQTPKAELQTLSEEIEYVGFWPRVAASLLDSILIVAITYPLLYMAYGSDYFLGEEFAIYHGNVDFLLSYVFPAVAAILFWRYKSATPGKMAIGAIIVDESTGDAPSTGRLIGRYFGYFPAMLILGLGLFWVGWDSKKQGWHDKMAKTIVIKRH